MRGYKLQASLGMLPLKFAPEPSLEPLTPALSQRAREPVEISASLALQGRPMIVGTKWIGDRQSMRVVPREIALSSLFGDGSVFIAKE